ncbi:GNAT family N-acetyltransferase [Paenibacillus anaericanus]|uniref:GNAT family N-acetyltransferase n=1 Tax=Paenibacillus anaericanus TaxID=170367 RepID=A0A3S1EFC9_9BACL|nr:GNAT family N-acetyltransferase [Paenibacillus anaericanus]RUT44474.1 GNAT family N-acetyltransferase [Paenibacillus anaericanus]
MKIILKELMPIESQDVFHMIQEIGEGQNGFVNNLYSDDLQVFQEKLNRNHGMSQGINLPGGAVPQTIFWFYIEDKLVGYGKMRHYLNEKLQEHGGHIGYIIRPSERRKGYGEIALKELVIKANEKGIQELLLTCDESNIASRRVIESNKGILSEMKDGICKYWIKA